MDSKVTVKILDKDVEIPSREDYDSEEEYQEDMRFLAMVSIIQHLV